jgi:hypothetical protein
VSAVDGDLLRMVTAQRVVTATQLERLFPTVPGRTLRYRTERLIRLGLLGHSRPYRDSGSAPFHFWPTRAGDAWARGGPRPRGGGRSEPNPSYLAHAAGLTALYAGLAGGGLSDARLAVFQREAAAREPYLLAGRPYLIVPDVFVELVDTDGGSLLAHIELDRGTMSHPKLKLRAAAYVDYAACKAWTLRHRFCPCLLFVTTTEARARNFLRTLAAALDRSGRGAGGEVSRFTAAACAMASDPGKALTEPCWFGLRGGTGGRLADCLRAARAPYDAERAQAEAKRAALAAREQRIARLESDPDALRQHLRARVGYDLTTWLERLGKDGHRAFEMLIQDDRPLSDVEREALLAFAKMLGEDVLEIAGRRAPSGSVADPAFARLVTFYRDRQQRLVLQLLRRDGSLPCLRAAQDELDRDALLEPGDAASLSDSATREALVRRELTRDRRAYVAYRDDVARAKAGFTGRLRGQTADVAMRIDLTLVRRCGRCEETIPPGFDQSEHRPALRPVERCPFCGGSDLRAECL